MTKTAKKTKVRKAPIFKYEIDVVGLGFRMKRQFRETLAKHMPVDVHLVREQTNRYDINAIMVKATTAHVVHSATLLETDQHIGYIRAESAALLAPLMDNREDGGMVFKSAKLTDLYKDDDHRSGVLDVEFYDYRNMAPTL